MKKSWIVETAVGNNSSFCDKIIGIQRRQGCYIDATINLAK
jgi:hypothetical protein